MTQPWSAPGPPGGPEGSVTLVEGSTFCISGADGDVGAGGTQGLFFRDTRYLSRMETHVNGRSPELLGLDLARPYSATFLLRSGPGPERDGPDLLLARHRQVGRGMREELVVRNYGDEPAYCSIELRFQADFAELAAVKEGAGPRGGELSVLADGDGLVFQYQRGALRRGARISLQPKAKVVGETATYEVIVPARGEWTACLQVVAIVDNQEIPPLNPCGSATILAPGPDRRQRWRSDLPVITTDNAPLRRALRRGIDDLGALRMVDPRSPEMAVPAAGAPWHLTLYGRDSILTSLMALIVDPDLALGTLRTLARFQGQRDDPRTEEEPGRILHRMQLGGDPELALSGGTASYGSTDASPLFVMLLGELRRWGLASEAVDTLIPAADRALEWITTRGDSDGDGFIEYRRASDRGPINQGWRDSPDAIRFADGKLARAPVATCEIQGYTYAAYLARAFFAEEVGDTELASSYRQRARTLKEEFNRAFWIESEGRYAMALDADKVAVDGISSTIGHCLWTGIVDESRAGRVASLLMSEDLYSGWGVRTLAASSAGYHPLGYHTGAVWPHDNALCAAGLMRYGFVAEAQRIVTDMVAAARHFNHQMPELMGGFDRGEVSFPVAHPWACRPKAWAAATPLMFVRTLLRLDPWVPRKKVWLSPALPAGMSSLSIDRMPLAGRVTIDVDGDQVTVEGLPPDVERVSQPRRPLTA